MIEGENIYQRIVFIAVERHMMTNYSHLDSVLKDQHVPYDVVFLPIIPKMGLIERIRKGNHVLKSLRAYFKRIFPHGINNALIIYSSGEGFLFSNKTKWMPCLTSCREVALQHGVMPLVYKWECLRKMVNAISLAALGFYIYGKGFGGVHTDKFIVLGEVYADLFVNKKGWRRKDVIVSGSSLKPSPEVMPKPNGKVCLFLLQDISINYVDSIEEMFQIFDDIVKNLSAYYDKVIVRKHPKMGECVYDRLCVYRNVVKSEGTLKDDVSMATKVFSLFSSALIDASLMGREIVAIHIDSISLGLYHTFSRVVEKMELQKYLEKYTYNKDDDACLNPYYYDYTDNTRIVVESIMRKE